MLPTPSPLTSHPLQRLLQFFQSVKNYLCLSVHGVPYLGKNCEYFRYCPTSITLKDYFPTSKNVWLTLIQSNSVNSKFSVIITLFTIITRVYPTPYFHKTTTHIYFSNFFSFRFSMWNHVCIFMASWNFRLLSWRYGDSPFQVTSYSLVEVHRRFRRFCCLHI